MVWPLPKITYMMTLGNFSGGAQTIYNHLVGLKACGFPVSLMYHWGNVPDSIQNSIETRQIEQFSLTELDSDILVLTHWTTVYEAADFWKKKKVLFAQGYEPLLSTNPYIGLIKKAYKKIDQFLVPSNNLKTLLLHDTSAPISVVPNGIYPEMFFPDPEFKRVHDKSILFCFSNLTENKGISDAYRLVVRLKQIDPTLNVTLTALAPHLPKEFSRPLFDVIYKGVSPNHMRRLYHQSACLVSLSKHEGFGLTPLEAMACGTVPVCTDSGGIQMFFEPGVNGVSLPHSNTEQQARIILDLINDQQRWNKLSQNGVATAKRFLWKDIILDLAKFYTLQ